MCFATSGEPVADLNLAALWGSASDRDVDDLTGRLGSLDTMLALSGDCAERLAPKLRDAGFVAGGGCPLMTVELASIIPDGSSYRIEAARDEADIEAMAGVLADAYSLAVAHTSAAFGPGLLVVRDVTPFMAWNDDGPCSAVIATRVGTDVGIWAMGTTPRSQGRGAGRALLGGVLQRFAAEGAERGFLFPSPAGRRLYDSLGFVEADRSEIWLRGMSTEFPE